MEARGGPWRAFDPKITPKTDKKSALRAENGGLRPPNPPSGCPDLYSRLYGVTAAGPKRTDAEVRDMLNSQVGESFTDVECYPRTVRCIEGACVCVKHYLATAKDLLHPARAVL